MRANRLDFIGHGLVDDVELFVHFPLQVSCQRFLKWRHFFSTWRGETQGALPLPTLAEYPTKSQVANHYTKAAVRDLLSGSRLAERGLVCWWQMFAVLCDLLWHPVAWKTSYAIAGCCWPDTGRQQALDDWAYLFHRLAATDGALHPNLLRALLQVPTTQKGRPTKVITKGRGRGRFLIPHRRRVIQRRSSEKFFSSMRWLVGETLASRPDKEDYFRRFLVALDLQGP